MHRFRYEAAPGPHCTGCLIDCRCCTVPLQEPVRHVVRFSEAMLIDGVDDLLSVELISTVLAEPYRLLLRNPFLFVGMSHCVNTWLTVYVAPPCCQLQQGVQVLKLLFWECACLVPVQLPYLPMDLQYLVRTATQDDGHLGWVKTLAVREEIRSPEPSQFTNVAQQGVVQRRAHSGEGCFYEYVSVPAEIEIGLLLANTVVRH